MDNLSSAKFGNSKKEFVEDIQHSPLSIKSSPPQFEQFSKLGKESPSDYGMSSTFLGSNLWEYTLPFEPDFNNSLDYLQLQNILDENEGLGDFQSLLDNPSDKSNNSTVTPKQSTASTVPPNSNLFASESTLNNFNSCNCDSNSSNCFTNHDQASALSTPIHVFAPLADLQDSSRDSSNFSGFEKLIHDRTDSPFPANAKRQEENLIHVPKIKDLLERNELSEQQSEDLFPQPSSSSSSNEKNEKSDSKKIKDPTEKKYKSKAPKIKIDENSKGSNKRKTSNGRKRSNKTSDESSNALEDSPPKKEKKARNTRKPNKRTSLSSSYSSGDEYYEDDLFTPKTKKDSSSRKIPYNDEIMLGSMDEDDDEYLEKTSRKSKKSYQYRPSITEVEDLSEIPGADFNPCEQTIIEDYLKPQPIIKKGRKKYVPSDSKDDKYWARRVKNNIAAKRSRDARRVKENQVILRANYLEDRHTMMEQELAEAKKCIESLKTRLSKYEEA